MFMNIIIYKGFNYDDRMLAEEQLPVQWPGGNVPDQYAKQPG